jgi:hypothetical protein
MSQLEALFTLINAQRHLLDDMLYNRWENNDALLIAISDVLLAEEKVLSDLMGACI